MLKKNWYGAVAVSALLLSNPLFAADEAPIIRALRDQSNLGLLTHQINPVMDSLSDDFVLVGGTSGIAHPGKAHMREYYLKSFADPDFVSFVRQARDITISDDGLRAAERGIWEGVFKSEKGGSLMNGEYLAHWAKRDGKWTDLAEVYVTLHCNGPKC